jgi:acetylornithine deacetylase/succinyl-diaminopimelate desuccinylase-like protein
MSADLQPVSPELIEAFFEYLRFPTISADPGKKEAMRDCVEWLRERFTRIGFEAKTLETAGAPAFLASSPRDPAKKTILIYGHYDVQPVDPLNLWRHDPFEPVIEDSYVVARGATDNKGQTFSHILGTEAVVRDGELPVNLIYLIEGEEEIGSGNLAPLLEAHCDLLRCDAIVISDTSVAGPDYPAITCGLRGIVCMEVHMRGAHTDLHSGMYGGVIANPATELARLLARLHDSTGAIAIPGFYDDILLPTARELDGWRGIPFDEAEILRATGARSLGGEANYTPLERIWTRPTAEINGLTSGYQGAGSKTIIPAEASAKLSFRLVPGQDPDRIAGLVRDFLTVNCPPALEIDVTYDHGGEPYYASPDSPASLAAQRALAAVFGREPALLREGLSIPVVSTFQRLLGREPLLIGLGMPDCAAHAPNETFPLIQLQRGILLHRQLLHEFAASL